MEKVLFVLANPWLLLILMLPLLAPLETLLLILSIVYAFVVYLPYKLMQSLYRIIRGKNTSKKLCTQQTESPALTHIPDTLEKMSCSACGGSVLEGSRCAYCGSTYIKSKQPIAFSERQGA